MRTLKPFSFQKLMGMIVAEHNDRGSIFGVTDLYHAGRARIPVFGQRIENPIGVSAGPVTQLAQGIVAAYAAGARYIELRTLYAGEREPVPKPYIDAPGEMFHVGGATELSAEQAFNEYVKAWYAVKLISSGYSLGVQEGFIFNMSLGGSLEGLKSRPVDNFIEGLKSAEYTPIWRECENWARAHMNLLDGVDGSYISDISAGVSDSVTYVPRPGATAEEIEAAAAWLIGEKRLHTFVRIEPTMLGYYGVRGILDIGGYGDLELEKERFDRDLQFDDAKAMFLRLQSLADSRRLEFGVKIAGGLPVRKRGDLLYDEMLLTGKALFPVTFALAEKIAGEFGGGLRVSYAGGADITTAAKLFEAGVWPVTFASELMKPGAHLRLKQIADAVSRCDYAQFSGIFTSDLPEIEKEAYESGRYKNRYLRRAPKAPGPIPAGPCHISPCRSACPLGQDIPYILRLIKDGKKKEALGVILERNPLPFTTGALCAHPCMDACTRRFYECPIDIRGERYRAAKEACFDVLDATSKTKKDNLRVAVVGCGPAGIAAAAFLARRGCPVTVFDRSVRPGGAIQKYIPKFRVPDSDFEWDVTLTQALGVELELEHEVASLDELRDLGYEHIVLAVGAEEPIPLKLAFGKSAPALEFLEKYKENPDSLAESYLGNVAVVGSGIEAVDAARSVKRLPSVESVTVVADCPMEQMAARPEMIAAAKSEGVRFRELLLPTGLRGGWLLCHRAAPGEPQKDGTIPMEDTGEKDKVEADCVIAALGERPASPLFEEIGADVSVVGDAAHGRTSVAEAAADAQRFAAKLVRFHGDRWLPYNEAPDLAFLPKRGKVIADCAKCPESSRCLECETVCEFCAECCPNRAYLRVALPDGARFLLHIYELCDECGACACYCPYDGKPYREKFTLYLNEEDFRNGKNDGFFVTGEGNNCRFRYRGSVFKYDPVGGPMGMLPDELRDVAVEIIKKYSVLVKSEEH